MVVTDVWGGSGKRGRRSRDTQASAMACQRELGPEQRRHRKEDGALEPVPMAKTDHHLSLPRTRWRGRSSGRGRCRAGQNPSDITTSAITERLGLSRGALFRHFPNQDAIVQAVVSWAAGRLMARVTQQ